jgi:hypothetical protein
MAFIFAYRDPRSLARANTRFSSSGAAMVQWIHWEVVANETHVRSSRYCTRQSRIDTNIYFFLFVKYAQKVMFRLFKWAYSLATLESKKKKIRL